MAQGFPDYHVTYGHSCYGETLLTDGTGSENRCKTTCTYEEECIGFSSVTSDRKCKLWTDAAKNLEPLRLTHASGTACFEKKRGEIRLYFVVVIVICFE